STGNTVGGGSAGARNVISGNTSDGIELLNTGTNANIIAGNYVGTDVGGTLALGNGASGVHLTSGPQFNRIGTDGDGVNDVAERNIIAASGGVDVSIGNV